MINQAVAGCDLNETYCRDTRLEQVDGSKYPMDISISSTYAAKNQANPYLRQNPRQHYSENSSQIEVAYLHLSS